MDNYFSKKTVVITGTLQNFSRKDLQEKMEELGAIVKSTVSKKTDYLIAGEKAGSKLLTAQSLNVEVIFEEKLLEILAGETQTNFFAEKQVVITGTLKNFKRKDVEEKIESMGGIVKSSISKSTDCLITATKIIVEMKSTIGSTSIYSMYAKNLFV